MNLCILDPESYFDNIGQVNSFNKNDGIYVPENWGNILLMEGKFFLMIENSNNYSYGKAIKYTAPSDTVLLPKMIMNKIGLEYGDFVSIRPVDINQITNITFSSPKCITNPIAILEFELKNRNTISLGDMIIVKMFEKTYDFVVMSLITDKGDTMLGKLYGDNINVNINIDVEYY